jgi:hypothetical protein
LEEYPKVKFWNDLKGLIQDIPQGEHVSFRSGSKWACRECLTSFEGVNGCQWVSMGTGSMISVPVPLDNYGTRARPRTRAGISIRVIHGYLDTHRYSRVPMDI